MKKRACKNVLANLLVKVLIGRDALPLKSVQLAPINLNSEHLSQGVLDIPHVLLAREIQVYAPLCQAHAIPTATGWPVLWKKSLSTALALISRGLIPDNPSFDSSRRKPQVGDMSEYSFVGMNLLALTMAAAFA